MNSLTVRGLTPGERVAVRMGKKTLTGSVDHVTLDVFASPPRATGVCVLIDDYRGRRGYRGTVVAPEQVERIGGVC